MPNAILLYSANGLFAGDRLDLGSLLINGRGSLLDLPDDLLEPRFHRSPLARFFNDLQAFIQTVRERFDEASVEQRFQQRVVMARQEWSRLEAAIKELKGAGVTRAGMQRLVDQLAIELVFTAHPTEAKRRTIAGTPGHGLSGASRSATIRSGPIPRARSATRSSTRALRPSLHAPPASHARV